MGVLEGVGGILKRRAEFPAWRSRRMWPWCREPFPCLCSLLVLDPLGLPVGPQKCNLPPLDSPPTPRALFWGKFCLRGKTPNPSLTPPARAE